MKRTINAIIGYSELLLEDAEDDGAESATVVALTTIRDAGLEALSRVWQSSWGNTAAKP
jgi:hypothetical protein